MNFKELLKEHTQGILTEEALNAIEEAFQLAVEEKAELKVTSALIKQDEDYTNKMVKLVEAIDENHAKKFKEVFEKFDKAHAAKLLKVANKYKKIINEDAAQFKNKVLKQLSNYLELYLEQSIPNEVLAKNMAAYQDRKILEQIKQTIGYNESIANESFKEAMQDGKRIIERQKQEADRLIKENAALKKQAERLNAALLLEKKVASLPKEKQTHLKNLFADKDVAYITENFNYASSMYEKNQEERITTLRQRTKPQSAGIDRPQSKILNERISHSSIDVAEPVLNPVNEYLGGLDKISNKSF